MVRNASRVMRLETLAGKEFPGAGFVRGLAFASKPYYH